MPTKTRLAAGAFFKGSLGAVSHAWLACSLLAGAAFAQLDLGALYTQTVKTGQPWAAIDTKVNSLTVDVKINRGVVTTVATIEYTPGKGVTSEYICRPALPCEYRVTSEKALDSLETSAYFSQADNTVLTDMYLWVGDTKVKADLQERALASAQYEDIVKRRKDPALLETWGNGSYNLRIFPNESGKARKIEIEFVQGMENEGNAIRTALPVLHRLAKVASAGGSYESLPNRILGSVSLTAASLDGKSYRLEWPGLGSGEVGAAPLKLSASNIAELKEGTVSAPAASCAGCLTPWLAQHAGNTWLAEKASASYFGVKALLVSKDIKLESEPAERHFLLDVDGKDTALASRARKVALLSLKAYGGAPYAANLGLADGKGNITYVFPKAVPMDAENLRKAYDALRAWRPGVDADAHATLRGYAKARGAGAAPAVAYLVNNDTTPYYQWTYLPNGGVKSGTQAEYEAWEKERSAFEDQTLEALKAANAMLFGFWNDYRLNRLATATGGFQVGSLHGYIYYPRNGGVVADLAADKAAPIGIHLPLLFGPGRPDAYAIADLKVVASGVAIDRLVVLQAFRYFYYDIMAADGAKPMLAKRSDIAPYYPASPDSFNLRLAGQYKTSGTATLAISGLWGGLRFTHEVKVDLPSTAGAGWQGAGLWAYQQGEAWGRETYKYDAKAVQQLGKDYHIVNRQMSLLALEPGVPLWTELPSRNAGGTGARELNAGAPVAGDSKMFAGQTTAALDQVSLEDILASGVPIRDPIPGKTGMAEDFVLRKTGSGWQLGWNLPEAGDAPAAVFRILDLSGKAVAELPAIRSAGGYSAEWRGASRPGTYFVIAKAGDRTMIKRILVRP